jgi:hypothetical protein
VAVGGDWGAVHRAIVRGFDPHGVMVEIPTLAAGGTWGPIPTAVPDLAVSEQVLVAQVSTSRDTLIVIGRVPGRASTIGEIPGLTAIIAALQAADVALAAADVAIQAAATALTTRVTAAEGTISSHTATLASYLTSINANTTNIATNTANIAANTSAIAANTATLTSYDTRLSALEDLTAVGKRRTVYQSTDQQQNNANGGTTYTNSTYLTLPVVASGVYILKSELIYNTTTTPKIKFKFNPPASSGLRLTPWFSGAVNGDSPIWHDAFDGFEFFPEAKAAGGGMTTCRPGGWLIVAGTAGNFTLQFAQNTADVAFAVLESGSSMELTRVA